MAWYEMQGGGIPAGLKTDMNTVLNKKMGTSTVYAPDTWAPTVNLMGPLPEKTVSGSVVAFSDGADTVPLKKCEVSMPASVDGYLSVDVLAAGKNVFDMDNINQISLYSNLASGYWYTDKIVLPANTTFTISPSSTAALGVGDYFVLYINPDASDPDYLVITNPSIKYVVNAGNPVPITFTTGATGVIRFGITSYAAQPKQSAFDAFLSIYYQIEAGSTANTFEPFAGTTYTASLGRTIHGGTADIVNGEGESLCGKITFDGSENWVEYAAGNGYLVAVADMERGTWYTSDLALSSPLPKVPDNNSLGVRIGVNNNCVYVVQANTLAGVTDLASFKTYLSNNPMTIIYPLDVTEAFTFDPVTINSKYGNNTIWSQEGSSEVIYRADIDLALSQ